MLRGRTTGVTYLQKKMNGYTAIIALQYGDCLSILIGLVSMVGGLRALHKWHFPKSIGWRYCIFNS